MALRLPRKKILIQGFQYILGTTRKDGSETYKCAERDCEARVHKKDKVCSLVKDHGLDKSSSGALQHVYMFLLKDRATKNLEESPADLMKNVTKAVTELIIASVPSPKAIEDVVKEWREMPAPIGKIPRAQQTRTPRNGSREGSASKSHTPSKTSKATSRKRLKLVPKGDEESEEDEEDVDVEEEEGEEEEEEEIKPKKGQPNKRARAKVAVSSEEEEEDSEEE